MSEHLKEFQALRGSARKQEFFMPTLLQQKIIKKLDEFIAEYRAEHGNNEIFISLKEARNALQEKYRRGENE